MGIDLKISVEQVQAKVPVTVFRLLGWMDAQSEDLLLQTARKSYEEGARFLLMDLKDVTALTSAGMRSIQKIYKMYTPEEQRYKVALIKLCNAPPQIYHVLGITGFLQNVPNYESRQAALDSFGE
jgi:anti-anti-sigma factor